MPLDQIRLTINADGRARRILTVSQTKSGDLNIGAIPAGFIRDVGVPITHDGWSSGHHNPVQQEYFSIHQSPDDARGNLITRTIVSGDGPPAKSYHWTKVLKQTNKFAHVFTRRFGAFNTDKYALNSNRGRVVHLGDIKQEKFTLFLSLFCGNRERQLHSPLLSDLAVHQEIIGNYRIVVIWSFVSLPSHTDGAYIRFETNPVMEGEELEEGDPFDFITEGFNDEEVIYMHSLWRNDLLDELMMILRVQYRLDPFRLSYLRARALFFKQGTD